MQLPVFISYCIKSTKIKVKILNVKKIRKFEFPLEKDEIMIVKKPTEK